LDPDPYWIQIRIGIKPKMLELDPDPDEMNADPQPCLQEGLELAVDVVEDGAEAVLLVDLVAVADGVDEGQLEVDVALLELVGVGLKPNTRLIVALGRRVKTDAKMPYI
jgi:hypothetical protein